jgi:ubiquinone/menaquinone biosynthesis C-methylase UbiE/uncharacterized protein YbaR (Trm112 family)
MAGSEIFRCPDCRGRLRASDAALLCTACSASYPIANGVPALIGKSSALNLDEVATQDLNADHYNATRYGRTSSVRYHEDTMEQLVELAPPRGTVLDAGCGSGAFLEFARRRGENVERYVGIDVSGGMLAHAAQRLRVDGVSQVLAQADALRLPFDDNTFDVVYARALLHHLPDPHAGVQEIRRVLKPGGSAVVVDPNKNIISALPRVLARYTDRFDADHKNFAASELAAIVGSALDVGETRFFGYLAYPLLGFPDLIDFDRMGISRVATGLIRFDRVLGKVPLVKRLAWGMMMLAHKPAANASRSSDRERASSAT